MASGGRRGSFLGIKGLEDIAKIHRNTKRAKVAVDGLKNTFIYWLGDDSGGAFTKRAANDFTQFLREAFFKEKATMQYGFDPLTKRWADKKANPNYWGGKTLDSRVGIATHQMINAIRPIDQGGGLWRVGISNNETVSERIGNITRIADYAKILELGSVKQSPRPVFSSAFLEWSKNKLPKLIHDSITAKVTERMQDIWREIGENKPDKVPEGQPTISLYDDRGGLEDISTGIDTTEEAVIRRRGEIGVDRDIPEQDTTATGEDEYAFDEAEGFPESERIEEYIQHTWEGGTVYMTKSGAYVWNWVDKMWQDTVTAFTKLKGYGRL